MIFGIYRWSPSYADLRINLIPLYDIPLYLLSSRLTILDTKLTVFLINGCFWLHLKLNFMFLFGRFRWFSKLSFATRTSLDENHKKWNIMKIVFTVRGIIENESSLCHKLKLSNPYIFATRWNKPLIF